MVQIIELLQLDRTKAWKPMAERVDWSLVQIIFNKEENNISYFKLLEKIIADVSAHLKDVWFYSAWQSIFYFKYNWPLDTTGEEQRRDVHLLYTQRKTDGEAISQF